MSRASRLFQEETDILWCVLSKRDTLSSRSRSPRAQEQQFPRNRSSWNRLPNQLNSTEHRSFRPRIPYEHAPLPSPPVCLRSLAPFFLLSRLLVVVRSFLQLPRYRFPAKLQWQSVSSWRDAVLHRARTLASFVTRRVERMRARVWSLCNPLPSAIIIIETRGGEIKEETSRRRTKDFLLQRVLRFRRTRVRSSTFLSWNSGCVGFFVILFARARACVRVRLMVDTAMETTRCAHVTEEENLYQVYNHEKATGNLVTLGKCTFPFLTLWNCSWDRDWLKDYFMKHLFDPWIWNEIIDTIFLLMRLYNIHNYYYTKVFYNDYYFYYINL